MQTEGYLFLPWDEEVFGAMGAKFSAAFEKWKAAADEARQA